MVEELSFASSLVYAHTSPRAVKSSRHHGWYLGSFAQHATSQPMPNVQMAVYFCTGDKPAPQWRHYALNVPSYTHFTSPIRRYPDVVVHRQVMHNDGTTKPAGTLPQIISSAC